MDNNTYFDKKIGHNGNLGAVKITTTISKENYKYVLDHDLKFSDLLDQIIEKHRLLNSEERLNHYNALKIKDAHVKAFLDHKGLDEEFMSFVNH